MTAFLLAMLALSPAPAAEKPDVLLVVWDATRPDLAAGDGRAWTDAAR